MSTRITQSIIHRSLLSDLNDVSDRLARTQRKLSSGKEITRPSDDPFGASRAMSLRDGLEGTRQYRRNAREAVAWTNVTEVALSRITDATQRARELLVQGASDSNDQTARDSIASEIDSLIDSAKQEANANYSGRFVFAGTATGTKPYAVGGVDTYAGDAASIVREIGPGTSVTVNVVGSSILGNGQAAADNKLLDVLRDIADDLRAGNGNALRGTDLQRLDANLDEILRQRAAVGATQNRIETADGRLAEIEEAGIKLLSETEDADIARALTDYSIQQSVYQSALRAGANIVQASLLDFLG